MELLIGIAVLALIAGMVCVWLTGNLFGRVLTFLVLAVVLAVVADLAILGSVANPNPLGLIVGPVVAWFVSGIPIYVRRAKAA